MSQNTVLQSQGDLPHESASHALTSAAITASSTAGSTSSGTAAVVPMTIDPVRALTQAWYRQPVELQTAPVARPFDAQYWACWLVAVVLPVVVGYLLLTR